MCLCFLSYVVDVSFIQVRAEREEDRHAGII